MTVLEAASEIGEVGAGIQILPNSARVLSSWGLMECLEPFATKPSQCNFFGWKGNHLSDMNYVAYAKASGAPFWDFYRANLHQCLLVSFFSFFFSLFFGLALVNFVSFLLESRLSHLGP